MHTFLAENELMQEKKTENSHKKEEKQDISEFPFLYCAIS